MQPDPPLSGGRVQWMGRVSFSLYLVHEPIVVSTAYALGGRPPVWAEMLIAVPVALLVAEGFYRGVEVPTVGFAHAIRKTVVRRAQDGPRSAPGRTPPLVSYANEVR